MDDVISVSSNDSDVEIVGSYNFKTKADPLPLTAVRVDVDVVNANVPSRYIDLTDPRWTLPQLKIRKRSMAVVDLTESSIPNGTNQETENVPPDDSEIKTEPLSETLKIQGFTLQKSSSEEVTLFAPQQDCGTLKPQLKPDQHQLQTNKPDVSPAVKLRRLPFLETHFQELETSSCSVYLTKDTAQMSLCFRQLNNESEAPEGIGTLRMITPNGFIMDNSLDESLPKVVKSPTRQDHKEDRNTEYRSTQLHDNTSQHLQKPFDSPSSDKQGLVTDPKKRSACEGKTHYFGSTEFTLSPTSPSAQDNAQGSVQREVICLNLEQPALGKPESMQNLSDHSPPNSPTTGPNSCVLFDHESPSLPTSHNHKSQDNFVLTCEHTAGENMSERQSEEVGEASNSPDFLHYTSPSELPLSVSETENMDEGSETYRGDLGLDSPVSVHWQGGSDGEEVNEDINFRAASTEERYFVCPVMLRKRMSGPAHALVDVEDEGFGAPEVLCHQSLSLVYSTIDENYTEGTLQLLSDLLQPGYYPPKDITTHLLHSILLDQQCPHHLCVQAFSLLMRTQRHHMADKTTVPWDWQLLTSVMASQDHTKKYRSDVVRMFLEYVVQTLEDDFQAKRSIPAVHHSIAKATLSCDLLFHQVRDIIKWLFATIMRSTDNDKSKDVAKAREDNIRLVSIFQRMLSLALEVDRSPALTSARLSQELFLMLISSMPLRAHRMLLLETMQSKLLRCKLLEHLLDYACPLKTPLPMSLSLLLHFMKNCTLAPDPTDGTERWQRWEELVHLLWMLLLSYNKAMKGYLCSSVTEQSGRVGMLLYRPDDKVSRLAICEAVEAFVSRSQVDLGQALPLHVEESLTYLQDHLLDVC